MASGCYGTAGPISDRSEVRMAKADGVERVDR
jgi:hypothetical protein